MKQQLRKIRRFLRPPSLIWACLPCWCRLALTSKLTDIWTTCYRFGLPREVGEVAVVRIDSKLSDIRMMCYRFGLPREVGEVAAVRIDSKLTDIRMMYYRFGLPREVGV